MLRIWGAQELRLRRLVVERDACSRAFAGRVGLRRRGFENLELIMNVVEPSVELCVAAEPCHVRRHPRKVEAGFRARGRDVEKTLIFFEPLTRNRFLNAVRRVGQPPDIGFALAVFVVAWTLEVRPLENAYTNTTPASNPFDRV